MGTEWIVHDPWRPMPAIGGHLSPSAGPADRATLDRRTDVATFNTPPLTTELQLFGHPQLSLRAQADHPGFDLCVSLSRCPEGGSTAEQLSTGVLRVLGNKAQMALEHVVQLQPLLATLKAGDQLRLSIAAAAWPAIGVNPGDGTTPSGAPSPQHRVVTLTLHLTDSKLQLIPMNSGKLGWRVIRPAVKLSAALLALVLSAPMGMAAPQNGEQLTTTELSAAEATAAAELALGALKDRDGDELHGALAEAVRTSVSKDKVQQRLNKLTSIRRTRVVGVAPGYNTTTIDAVVVTADGDQPLLMVLDEDGKLLAWKWSQQVQPIEATALEFVRHLVAEQWVLARTKLSLQLQEELSPADLERKWTKLNRVSGGFRELKDAVIASQGGDQQLVLVAVAFGKATSNLFVIFDQQGRIINVDISRDFV
jgi:hypothetical protein